MIKFILLLLLFSKNIFSNNLFIYNFQNQKYYEGLMNENEISIYKKNNFFKNKIFNIKPDLLYDVIITYEKTNDIQNDFFKFNDLKFEFKKNKNIFFDINESTHYIKKTKLNTDEIIDYIDFPFLHSDKVIKPFIMVIYTNEKFILKKNILINLFPYILIFLLIFLIKITKRYLNIKSINE